MKNFTQIIFCICLVSWQIVFAQTHFEIIEAETVFDALNPTPATNQIEKKTGGSNASGGEWVVIKSGNSLTFTTGTIPTSSLYYLKIFHFNNDSAQTAELSINGNTPYSVNLDAARWEYEAIGQYTKISVNLIGGQANTIEIARTSSNLLIDYIVVTDQAHNTYYVSNTGSDIAANGLTPATAWASSIRTNQAANTSNNDGIMLEGDKLLFNKGDTFIGQFKINCSGSESNPIEIGSYGSGAKPILTGVGAMVGNLGGDAVEVVKMTNTSNVIVQDLHIKNDRQTTSSYWSDNKSYGIYVKANKWGGRSSNLTFRNLDITDIFGVSMYTNPETGTPEFVRDWYTARGIYFDSEKNHDFDVDGSPASTEVGIDDVLVENCYFYNLGGRGISTTHKANNANTSGDTHRNRNYVIRNNYFEQLGGDGVVFASMFNGLVENNEFHDLGYGDHTLPTDKYFGRGEGCWIWNSWNIVVQYNKQYNNKGYGDTYGAGGHVDFYCKNSLFQYNYSEDTDGGFLEILGDCDNSIFRYNVSVNDGHRTHHHNYTIWLSGYVGSDNGVPRPVVPPRDNYMYNNTVYVDQAAIEPQISIFAEDTYIFNNVFMYAGGSMGIRNEDGINGYYESMQNGGILHVSNNFFHGNISTTFKSKDANRVDDGSFPAFQNAGGSNRGDYDIWSGSPMVDNGLQFTQPSFPAAGSGIFAHIADEVFDDGFGNTVDINNHPPNIGASNSHNSFSTLGIDNSTENQLFTIFPNPVKENLTLQTPQNIQNATVQIFDVQGKLIHTTQNSELNGNTLVKIPVQIKNGIYFLKVSNKLQEQTQQFILYR
ncbi:hypothetical protein KH5_15780 [Urechidicola sp. KH5]